MRREIARHAEFTAAVEQIVEVSEKICEARPVAGTQASPVPGGEKGGLFAALAEARSAEIARLAAEAARALGCDGGLGAAEAVLRAGAAEARRRHAGAARSPTPASAARGCPAAWATKRNSLITGISSSTPSSARSRCAVPGITARNASTGSRRAMPSSASGARPCPGPGRDDRHRRSGRAVREAAGLLEDLAGFSLTVKRVERAAEASGAAQAAAVRERSAAIACGKAVPLPPSPCPDMLYGAIDGTGVTMTAKETAGRQGKGEDGRARTREVKLAVFFTQDETGDDGYPVRDPGSASYIATFEPASVFGDLVKAEGIRRGADHVRQLTILGDGAAWIWGIAADKFPEATQIVELFHAREHLNSLARSLEFMLLGRKDQWLAARLEDLDYGDIDGIEAAVRTYPLEGVKKDEVEKELGYFLNNAPRMRYKWFRSRGLFVGSGVVESGCKVVIGQRLKLSGMRWTVAGADAIATLRCQQASRPQDRIWQERHNQTVTA